MCVSAFLVLKAAAVLVYVPEKTQSGYVTEPPHGLTASNLPSIGFCSAKAGSSREPLGAKAQTDAASPALSSTRLRYISILRRLLDISCGGGRAGATAPGFATALAFVLLLGLLVAASRDAKIERLRAVYKTGANNIYTTLRPFLSGEITAEELDRILKP